MKRPCSLSVTMSSILLCLVSFALSSCGREGGGSDTHMPVVRIAAILPVSGPNAAAGIGMMNSMRAAVRDVNDGGSLRPYRLELLGLDDESKPEVAVRAAERAAQDPSVLAATAHWNSGCALATNPVFHRNGLVNLVPAAINAKITLEQAGDEIFRIDPHDLIIASYGAEFAATTMRWRKAFLIDDNTLYGKDLAENFRRHYVERGGQVVGSDALEVGEKDFGALLTRVKSSAPDVIFFGGVAAEAALLRRQMTTLGLNAEFISLTGIFTQAFIGAAGDAAEGTYSVTVVPPLAALPGGQEFIRSYERGRYQQPYEEWGIYAYASVQVLAAAIRDGLPKPTRRQVIESMKRGTFDTVLGTVAFDEHGQTKLITVFVYRVVDSVWSPLYHATGSGQLEGFRH